MTKEGMITKEVIDECVRCGLLRLDEDGHVSWTELGKQQKGKWLEYIRWVRQVEQALRNEHGPSLREVK